MMSEDLFFNKVKETMHGYTPEVPSSVYGGMRKKYAKSKFFSWNASSFNVWYVALVAVFGGIVFGACVDSTAIASKAGMINTETENLPQEISNQTEFVATEIGSCQESPAILTQYKGEPCLFPSSLVEVKEEATPIQPAEKELVAEEIIVPEEKRQEEIIVATPVEEVILKEEPKKATRKIKAPIFKDKQ